MDINLVSVSMAFVCLLLYKFTRDHSFLAIMVLAGVRVVVATDIVYWIAIILVIGVLDVFMRVGGNSGR